MPGHLRAPALGRRQTGAVALALMSPIPWLYLQEPSSTQLPSKIRALMDFRSEQRALFEPPARREHTNGSDTRWAEQTRP